MPLSVGTKLGTYEIVSLLGKGGMGEVWSAHDPRLKRDVAIKVSANHFTDRFEREAQAIAALNHPNVCTIFDVGPNYLVMELVEGLTLAERIKEGSIPLEEALGIAKQIAAGLEAAHEKNIVHRDLKPANIKIRLDGSVKVLDSGLAKRAEEAEFGPDSPAMLSNVGMILGTAGYMAPDQARGKKEIDKRADIWAFGVVLYEMLTGKRLFQGEDVSEILAAIIKEQPNLDDAPLQVQPLLKRCLEKDPKKRLRDIGDWELLLVSASGTGGPTQTGGLMVSSGGGTQPRGRGSEIIYISSDAKLMSVEVSARNSQFQSSAPKSHFAVKTDTLTGAGGGWTWDVTADGQRFLAVTQPDGAGGEPVTVVLNWERAFSQSR